MQSIFQDDSDPGRSYAIAKIGEVSAVDPATCTARVVFDDDESLVSSPLQIIQFNSLANKGYWLPDVGEDVVCLFMGTGVEEGFILGAVYAGDVKPPESNQDVRKTEFKDGNFFSYNRKDHVLSIKINDVFIEVKPGMVSVTTEGEADIQAGSRIRLKSNKVLIDSPDTELTGKLSVAGGISGGGGAGATINGPVNASGDVKAGNISLQGHIHTGDSGGDTSAPK